MLLLTLSILCMYQIARKSILFARSDDISKDTLIIWIGKIARHKFGLQPTFVISESVVVYRTHCLIIVGETGASCYRGRLLQGHFIQN